MSTVELGIGGDGGFCLANSTISSGDMASFRIGAGYIEDVPVVCLGERPNWNTCYRDQPVVHGILSAFDQSEYEPGEKEDSGDDEYTELSIEDVDELWPGTELMCQWRGEKDEEPSGRYDAAVFLTAEQSLEEGLIGVVYLDDESKEWIPASWCTVTRIDGSIAGGIDANVWSCNDSAMDSIGCGYMVKDNTALLHRAFRLLARRLEHNNMESNTREEKKSLFTYTNFYNVDYDDKGYVNLGTGSPLPPWMDTSLYSAVYSHLPFEHDLVQEIDNKFLLYQLYKDDPYASRVFPKTYATYEEALHDTASEYERMDIADPIFYVKPRAGTRGDGISIKTWKELSDDFYEKSMGMSGLDKDDSGMVFQRAALDLYTIDGDGPIAGRRFDIRYFVLIAHGAAYLHSNMLCKWAYGPKYDPKDTDPDHQVSNLKMYGGGQTVQLIFPDVVRDMNRKEWNDSSEKRIAKGQNAHHRELNPHGWRDALANALDEAEGVFANLKNLTEHDPTKYVLLGGDAMVREDGTVVLVEFNAWCDLDYYGSLKSCFEGEGCQRMVMQLDRKVKSDNYHVTEPTPVRGIVSSESLAGMLMDTISMVMQIESIQEIADFREIVSRKGQSVWSRQLYSTLSGKTQQLSSMGYRWKRHAGVSS